MISQLPDLEKRLYGPDSTEEEQDTIRAQAAQYSDDVFYYRETPVVARFPVQLIFDKLKDMSSGLDHFYLIVDLTVAAPPNGEARRYLSERFKDLAPAHVAVFTGKNFLLNVAAKFVLGKVLGGLSFSVHGSLDDAVAAIDQLRA